MTSARIKQRVAHWLKRFQLAPQYEVRVHHGQTLADSDGNSEGRIRRHTHRHQIAIEIPDGWDDQKTDWLIVHEVVHEAFGEIGELQHALMRRLPISAAKLAEDVLDEAEERLACRIASAMVGAPPLPEPEDADG